MSRTARSEVEIHTRSVSSGGPNGRPSGLSLSGEVVDIITRSSTPPQGDTETLKQVEGMLTKETQTSPTSHTVHPVNIKPTNSQITSKYKSKEEKKKARQVRRKANRAKYCSKHGNIRKPPNAAPVSKEKGSLENGRSNSNEIPKEQTPRKPSDKGISADDHRRSINKCRHLAVALRREDKAPVDRELAKLIRKRLTDLIGDEVKRILTTNSSGRVIQFIKSGLVSTGFFLVTPATEEARDWLLSRDFGLLDGTRVVVKKLERKKGKSKSGGEKRFVEDKSEVR